MTDRVDRITLILDRDMRVDDVEHLTNALRCMKYVADVQTHVTDHATHTAQSRLRNELRLKLWSVVDMLFDQDEDLINLIENRNRKRGY
jgi:hypothetical protein